MAAAGPPGVIFVTADATGPMMSEPSIIVDATPAGSRPMHAKKAPTTAAAGPPPPPTLAEKHDEDGDALPSSRRLAAEAEAALALSGLPAPFVSNGTDPWDDLLHLSPAEDLRARREARRLVARAAGASAAEAEAAAASSAPASSSSLAFSREAALEVAVARADAALDDDGECLAALWARGRALLAHGAAHAAVIDLRRLASGLPPIPEQWPRGLDALLRDAHVASRPEGYTIRTEMAASARGAAGRAAVKAAIRGRAEALERRGGRGWPPPKGAKGPSVLPALDARGAEAALAAALGGVERPHLLALGLREGATDQEVRSAFHALARALHPDKQRVKGLPHGEEGEEQPPQPQAQGGGGSAAPLKAKGRAAGLAPPPTPGTARTFEEAQEAYEGIQRLRGGVL